jgi:hypothetical protein
MRRSFAALLIACSCGGAPRSSMHGQWRALETDCGVDLTIDGTPTRLTGNGSELVDCIGTFTLSGTESEMVWTFSSGFIERYSVTFAPGDTWFRVAPTPNNQPGVLIWDFYRVSPPP